METQVQAGLDDKCEEDDKINLDFPVNDRRRGGLYVSCSFLQVEPRGKGMGPVIDQCGELPWLHFMAMVTWQQDHQRWEPLE